MIYLTGDHLPIKTIRQVAKKLKVPLWPNNEKPLIKYGLEQSFPKKLAVLAKDLGEDKLSELFFLPVSSVIDASALPESIESFLKKSAQTSLPNTLSFLLTCPVIYSANIAQIFMRALNRHLHFSRSQFENVHFALHESIVNGLIHGNLHVNSSMRQSARDFVEYARLLHDRLNDPSYANKSLSIVASWDKKKLEIKIRDEGDGYTSVSTPNTTSCVYAKSGRGLRIIAGTADSCTIEDFGREVTLSFLLTDTPASHWVENYQDDNQTTLSRDILASELNSCRVLVIEDNPSNQAVLARLLSIMGINQVAMANDGVAGLEKVGEFKPDLIVLDITMPRMNGYEVLHELKKDKATSDIPVLIQTAADNREAREKTFSSGATDFITKPINPLEFFARVRVHLENRLLIQNLEKQLSQIETELASAQKMQVGILPSKKDLEEVRKKYRLDVAQYFAPSSALGGDFWQTYPISASKLCVYLCDFSGHGMAAALNTFRLHALFSQMNKRLLDPAEALKKLNKQLYSLLPRGQFATLFLGIIDIKKREMIYSGASAPKPLLVNKGRKLFLHTEGMPLGIMANPKYKNYKVKMNPNDVLLLYSDALIETPNAQGERLGYEGLQKMVVPMMRQTDVNQIMKDIMQAFFNYAPPPPSDDVTAVLFRAGEK
ncbi:MAG: response regulator [Alphaproteobacteria bacterium]|nr:response regulator [Alphaproteobacteria bacterium]